MKKHEVWIGDETRQSERKQGRGGDYLLILLLVRCFNI